jgi:hypothetical protein
MKILEIVRGIIHPPLSPQMTVNSPEFQKMREATDTIKRRKDDIVTALNSLERTLRK